MWNFNSDSLADSPPFKNSFLPSQNIFKSENKAGKT